MEYSFVIEQTGAVVNFLFKVMVRSTYKAFPKALLFTLILNVGELEVVLETVTPLEPVQVYCVVPPMRSVAGGGNVILKEELLQSSSGILNDSGILNGSRIIRVTNVFGLS